MRALLAGRARFEAGAFFEAHEAWEVGFHATAGDERLVLQALVMWAAARHLHAGGRARGAHAVLMRALERLGRVAEGFDGLDVEALREALLGTLEAQRDGGAGAPGWLAGEAPAPLGDVPLEHALCCPYCGEAVLLQVAPEDVDGARYVEDCPVCCRPWQVRVSPGGASIERDDAGA
jgi:hypothetical protein